MDRDHSSSDNSFLQLANKEIDTRWESQPERSALR
jgi:hypothetical protein